MNNSKPVVEWKSPQEIPSIDIYSEKTYWVAIKRALTGRIGDTNETVHVFDAQYLNKPLVMDDNGDYENDDFLCDPDGEPMEAVGWFSSREHSEYDSYYEQLIFSDEMILLGWAEYEKPEFNL